MPESYNRSVNILSRISPSNNGEVTIVYTPNVVSPYDTVNTLRYYGFVTDLRATVSISSLQESAIPQIEIGASRTEKITTIRNLEWESPRFEMQILMKTSATGWLELARISLLNRQPYYIANLLQYLTRQLAFPMANDTSLAVRVVDVGYGLLRDNDSVVIYGAVREEVTPLPQEKQEIVMGQNSQVSLTANQSAIVIPANPNRKFAAIVNQDNSAQVFINYGAMAQLGAGITLFPSGGSYEINFSNLYKGDVTAICDSDVSLSILEGY